ncbi:hypothetical protein BGX34_002107 [Mortierella sp. NVP85]|nr:hypothetical protein BGX34_002107 [Mortierella sp. NVP85]
MTQDTGSQDVSMPVIFGGGIILRWSTQDDTENIADCLAEAFRWFQEHRDDEKPGPNEQVRARIRRLMNGNSGVMSPKDCAIAVNFLAKKGQNPVVACVCLLQSPGYYGKVKILYGKPEFAGTHPDFRNKGLMRALFDTLIHPASDGRGDAIQIIAGINHFYRRFGYEYAMERDTFYMIDNLFTLFPQLDPSTTLALPENEREPEPFTLREPSLDDIPYLVKMSTREKRQSRAGLGLEYFDGYWKYTIHDVMQAEPTEDEFIRTTRIIVDAKNGKDCGLIVAEFIGYLQIHIFTLEDGYHYESAVIPVLRQMIAIIDQPTRWEKAQREKEAEEKEAEEKEKEKDDKKNKEEKPKSKVQSISIALDHQHPVAKLLSQRITPKIRPYKLYTRIQSYAKFILTVRPELEDRLAKSCLAGITVTWQFDFFRKVLGSTGRGLEVVFKEGKIISASDDWVPLTPHATMMAARERIAKAKAEGRPDKKPLVYLAEFAPLSFTRLLVGDMSIEEMIRHYGECDILGGEDGGAKAQLILDILFPKQLFHFDLFWC